MPAVLALALGIGATTAIFSVVRGVVLKPLPYPEQDRVVVIWEHNVPRNRPRNVVAAANFIAWGERNRSFDALGLVGPARITVNLNGEPFELPGFTISADALRALAVQPAMGRLFTPDEDLQGNDGVILLGHDFWQTRLGARSDVLGSTVVANGRPRTVVGVMPAAFSIEGQSADFFIPYGWTIEQMRSAPGRGSSHGVARLRDGVSFEQAEAEMKAIAAALEQEAPQRNSGWSVTLVPIHEQTVGEIRPAVMVLASAVALVLLIACVNVANLLLARSTVRQRELGLRTALGARRGRLVRQMLSESLVLAAAGGAIGLALAYAFHRGLIALVADRIPVPRLDQVVLDFPVLAFTMLVALGTGLLFGILPAVVATSAVNDALREGGRHGSGPKSRRVLGALVVAEIALSLVLLAGAGLLIRSFLRLQSLDPGFRTDGVLTARVSLPGTRYSEPARIAGFYDEALNRIRALPGVQQAAGVTFLPMSGPGIGTSFYRLDHPVPEPGQAPVGEVRPVTPGFFRAMGIPQLAGRDIGEGDRSDAPPVAVVTETLVRRFYAGENPLGQRLHVNIGPRDGMQVEIVGVVGDLAFATLEAERRPAVFLPHAQLPIGLMTFVVQTSLEPLALAPAVAGAVRSLDPELPLASVRSLEDVVSATLARPRAVSLLLTAFALIALILAGVGVYGVMAYSVSQRTQEIGVRMALGATTDSVFRLVLGQALKLVAIGVVIGLVAAGFLTRLLTSLLYDTPPFEPVTFATTAGVLIFVAAVASYIPARRGMRIAPVEALRVE
jgi:putative ABC transport system permease protein